MARANPRLQLRSGEDKGLNVGAVQHVFKFQSGRVIALGRAVLAALFLLSILLDSSTPSQAMASRTYGVMLFYVLFACALAAITWRNWWLDARLAAPAHFVDMAVFTIIVFSTNGYTSPFFLFFVLPLLSAAIRWGWRETAYTAVALTLLYLLGGVFFASGERFELQRFIVRSTHLVILSAMLIWFGIHQRRADLGFRLDDFDSALGDERHPGELALRMAMEESGGQRGMLLLRDESGTGYSGQSIDAGQLAKVATATPLVSNFHFGRAILFDRKRDRVLGKTPGRRHILGRASRALDAAAAKSLGLSTGLIAQVRTGAGDGWLVIEGIPDLSTDHVEVGRELGRAAGALIERTALFGAIEDNAGARARLTLARDVHDSIVQFLAGATFRVEAIRRAGRSGGAIDDQLQELKSLLVDEQRDIRGFISAVRRERTIGLHEAAEDLRSLAVRLSQQWGVDCTINVDGAEAPIPLRIQLDLQQLVREAVANAVRHGNATRVEARLTVDGEELRLLVEDNGRGFSLSADGKPPPQPWSLKERVDRANGSLMLMSEPGRTRVAIALPLEGAPA